MSVMQSDPGTSIPGAFIPGSADPGFPDSEQRGGFVTLDTPQVISGAKTFTGPGSLSGGWFGAVTANDITILPNPAISASASMFLDNGAGQVWEFFSDNGGGFGVFDKTGNAQAASIGDAAHDYKTQFAGSLYSQNNTLDDGTGKLTAANDVHVGEWLYVAGNILGSGGYSSAVVTKTSNYSIGGTDSAVLANSSGITVTLPDATTDTGRVFTVKNIASGTATVATTSSQVIDGSATYSLSAQYKYVTVQSDGSNWFITANN